MRAWMRRARGITALAGVVVVACAACSEVASRPDGAVDGGARDAGRDAGRDGGRDAGRDAGMPDGGDPSIEVEPGWVRLEGFSRQCQNERATNPAPLLEVRWEPCPFDPESCVYLDWDPRFSRRFVRRGSSDHDGTKGVFVMSEVVTDDEGEGAIYIDAVADTDGRVYAAWRDVRDADRQFACGGVTAVGAGRVAHTAQSLGPRPGTELLFGPHRLYWSDLEMASDGENLALVFSSDETVAGNFVQQIQTSESLVAMQLAPSGTLMLFDGTTWVERGGFAHEGFADEPRVSGGSAFWSSGGILTASMTLAPIVLQEGPLFFVDTAEPDLVWLRVVDREPDGTIAATELWTAPLTTDPAALRPRQVGPRIDPAGTGAAVGQGLYAYNSQQPEPPYLTSIYVIDLGDGSRRRYDLPTGDVRWLANWVEWVTPDEVAFYGKGRLADGTLVDGTLVRVRLSAFVPDLP